MQAGRGGGRALHSVPAGRQRHGLVRPGRGAHPGERVHQIMPQWFASTQKAGMRGQAASICACSQCSSTLAMHMACMRIIPMLAMSVLWHAWTQSPC